MHAFIHDAKRFALYNRSVIEQAPLQLYCSALVFAPRNSIIRRQFEDYIPDWIQLKPKVQAHWNAALQTLEGHSRPGHSVAFSPDGKQVVSGSAIRRYGSGTRPREHRYRRSRATVTGSPQWPSRPTVSRSCLDLTIGRYGSGTRPREHRYRRSRATVTGSPQWPSHSMASYCQSYK